MGEAVRFLYKEAIGDHFVRAYTAEFLKDRVRGAKEGVGECMVSNTLSWRLTSNQKGTNYNRVVLKKVTKNVLATQ